MNTLIKWTLRQRRTSTVWWSIGSFGLIFINMIFYPSFKDQAEALQKSFESLPDAAVQLFGGSTDFFSPIGFLNSQIFFFMLPLLFGILAISLGSNLIAREEQNKTIESLLSRPVSRNNLLTSKALAGVTILTIVALVSLITTLITKEIVGLAVGADKIIMATLVCWLMSLCLGAIAFVLTSGGHAKGASVGIVTTIALGGYIISSLAGTVSWLKAPSKLFPFHYFQSERILRGTYNWKNILFFVVVIFACGLLSSLLFRKRDLS